MNKFTHIKNQDGTYTYRGHDIIKGRWDGRKSNTAIWSYRDSKSGIWHQASKLSECKQSVDRFVGFYKEKKECLMKKIK